MKNQEYSIEQRIQKGIYNYLMNRGYSKIKMREVVRKYGELELGLVFPKTHRLEWYLDVEDIITKDFNPFKIFVKVNYRRTKFHKKEVV